MPTDKLSFFDKLDGAIERNQSILFVGLDPNPELVAAKIAGNLPPDDLLMQLRDWLQFIIAQTAHLVCAYKPSLGFYTALGAPGLELLQYVLASIPEELPVILDVKHGDLNSSSLLAETLFEKWGVDALTLSPFAGQDIAAPFLLYPDKAVFVSCHTSNPGAVPLQEYPNGETPFYLHLVKQVQTWGTPQQLGLEVGGSEPSVLAKIRAIAPERLIMARSIWSEGSDLAKTLAAGLNANADGFILPVPQDLLARPEPAKPILSLREAINQATTRIQVEDSVCDVWLPNVCVLERQPHDDLILQLFDLGCIMFGDYVQASGSTFPYYIDLRKIISNPQVFDRIIGAYAEILQTLTFDRIAGIPYGSLPTATGLSLRLNRPMIFPRKEVKAHGTRRVVEGHFQPGETIVVVDDILISGKSVMEGAAKLQSTGLKIKDIVVFIDHGRGVKERLRDNGYRAHSVLNLAEIAETLYRANRIDRVQFEHLGETG